MTRMIKAGAVILVVLLLILLLGYSLGNCSELIRYPLKGQELIDTQTEIKKHHLDFTVMSGYVLTTSRLLKQKTCIICVAVKKGLCFFEVQFFKLRGKIVKTRTVSPPIGEIRDLLRENI